MDKGKRQRDLKIIYQKIEKEKMGVVVEGISRIKIRTRCT